MFRKKDRQLLDLIESQTRSIAALTMALTTCLADEGHIDGDKAAKISKELMKTYKVRD
jgi:hypothetical protein